MHGWLSGIHCIAYLHEPRPKLALSVKSPGFDATKIAAMAPLSSAKHMPVRILIADDDACIRGLLSRLLGEHEDWEVCGEAGNGQEAIQQAEKLTPDIAIIDLAMPCMNGLEAAREISKMPTPAALLLLTVQEVSTQLIKEARQAGFKGAVSKGTGAEVIKGVETLLCKQTYFKSGPAVLSGLPHSAAS